MGRANGKISTAPLRVFPIETDLHNLKVLEHMPSKFTYRDMVTIINRDELQINGSRVNYFLSELYNKALAEEQHFMKQAIPYLKNGFNEFDTKHLEELIYDYFETVGALPFRDIKLNMASVIDFIPEDDRSIIANRVELAVKEAYGNSTVEKILDSLRSANASPGETLRLEEARGWKLCEYIEKLFISNPELDTNDEKLSTTSFRKQLVSESRISEFVITLVAYKGEFSLQPEKTVQKLAKKLEQDDLI